MKNGAAPQAQESVAMPPQQPQVPADFDWMEAFNVAAAQRDETTRNLQNFQVQTAIDRKKLTERIAELEGELEDLKNR